MKKGFQALRARIDRLPTAVKYGASFLCFALMLVLLQVGVTTGMLSSYMKKLLMLVGINMILALSLNMAAGYLGQLPLGHAGFMAVGAYASGIFMRYFSAQSEWIFPLGILVGGLVAAVFGVLIGIPALRLRGDYLAIITLGFSEIIRVIILNIDSVLGFDFTYGAASLKNIPKTTTVLNIYFYVGLTVYVIYSIMRSRHGRAILSIRENEIASEFCGVKITSYKLTCFTISAFFAGVAGALYAGYLGILNPSSFKFMKSIEILVMVVLGGMGSMTGSLISASVLTVVPEMLRSSFAEYRMIAYSLLLIIAMIFRPSGLLGKSSSTFGSRTDGFFSALKVKLTKKKEESAE